jgi:pyruvate,water dikinase
MTAARVFAFRDPLPAGAEARALVGGKGASLRDLVRLGLPVPPGFTLSVDCCAAYFERGRRWPEGLEEEVRAALGRLEEETGRRFGGGAQPLLVSVRSGAAVSMPGMMDTILNCGLPPEHGAERAAAPVAEPPLEPWDLLARSIDRVFDSWESPRALAYRRRHGIAGLRGTAVTVQAMFPAEVSGVLFSEDPNDPDAGRLVIESSWGLGEAVVSGGVTPDRFLVARADFAQVETQLGRKRRDAPSPETARPETARPETARPETPSPETPSLDGGRVRELAALGLRLERLFGHPVDIEWAWAAGELAVLQARPIRGLDVARDVEVGRREEIARLKALGAANGRLWARHNLDETLSSPTPLTWDLAGSLFKGEGGFARMYRELGYRPSRRVSEEGFLELICGRVYADPERLAELFWDGLPLAYDPDLLRADRSALERAPSRFDPARADGRFLLTLPANVFAMLRAHRRTRRAARGAKRRFEEALAPFLRWVDAKRAEDLASLSAAALAAELEARRARVLDDFAAESLLPGLLGGLAYASLEARLAAIAGRERGSALAQTLVQCLDGDTTFEQDALLYSVARGESAMEDFLERFGHRASGEMELSRPRWREDPEYVEGVARRLAAAHGRPPEEARAGGVERREAALAELDGDLARWGGSSFREAIERDLGEARALLPYRETGKHYLMMGYELLRRVIEELGRRFDLAGDIYFLRQGEVARLARGRERLEEEIGETLASLAARRRLRWRSFQRLSLPAVIDGEGLETLGLAPPAAGGTELGATALSPGVAAGTARVVHHPEEAGDLGADYVLVCRSTDPGWTPLFLGARALVVEQGGVLSHGAIVARDFGLPAVVCPDATRLLASGKEVQVDGNRGAVVVL